MDWWKNMWHTLNNIYLSQMIEWSILDTVDMNQDKIHHQDTIQSYDM